MSSDQCEALRLSDEQRCENQATHADGRFCGFHARQVFGLYKGYKRRNAMLDSLDDDAPAYLKDAKEPLANDTFQNIEDEKTLREVHSHLFRKYVLIGKVIDARKLHHKHFYSLNFDYGHQAYLDKINNLRHTVLRALERLEKRTTKLLYEKEQWYSWVRKVQEEEEATREKEQKKIKQEAALFRRHMRKLQARLEQMRKVEEQKRQDAYLEDAYQERMAMSMDESEDDEMWDPIDDMEEDKRNHFIDLIKHFLWVNVLDADSTAPSETTKADEATPPEEPQGPSKKAKKRAKAKASALGSSEKFSSAYRGQKRLLEMLQKGPPEPQPERREPDKTNIETEAEMRKRLREGVKKNYDDIWGIHIVGTLENPFETVDKTAPMADDEIESVVKDIRDVKLLLFCRLLLGQASLLPIALRANTVEEFLNDPEVTVSDLRDLCLKVELPTLQDIRDACADFARGPDSELEEEEEQEEEESDEDDYEELLDGDKRYSHLQTDDWLLERFIAKEEKRNRPKTVSRKTKVTVCGKSIWNHASKKAMGRHGWFQFSVLAKDCDLKEAVELCRNWTEFTDLNLLTLWQFFPASNWASWGGNRLIQQLQELGFFPYFVDFDAQQYSHHNQVGGRGQGRRQHDIVETRNVLMGHMKRNDPVTRRFLHYLLMRPGEVMIVVRDGKDDRIITAPPDDEDYLWTYRKKQGLGRASKNEWTNLLEVGPAYFELTDILREWRLGFNDFYEVLIWDFAPCQNYLNLYNIVITELRNAWRIKHPHQMYAHMEPLLRTLVRNPDTMRTRQLIPDKDTKSLWDTVMDERNEFRMFDIKGDSLTCRTDTELKNSPYLFYNDVNVAEDKILFPDELTSNNKRVPFREFRNGVTRIEDGILPSTMRHIAKGMEALDQGKDPFKALEVAKDDEENIWTLPKAWETGLQQVHQDSLKAAQRNLLKRTGLYGINKTPSLGERLNTADPMEVMERDRSIGFKVAFHMGDLEPGARDKYLEVQEKISLMLSFEHNGPTDWVWFIIEMLDWLSLRGDFKDYAKDPLTPWPHAFIIHDLVNAFAAMAMFFPESSVTALVAIFLSLEQCESFKKSPLFDPKERSKTLPDRRTRTSFKFRKPEFWKKWNEFLDATEDKYFAEVYPVDWSMTLRPIIAHLYQAGIVAPAYVQNVTECVAGMAMAATEPHRPGKLDLFIDYKDRSGGHFSPIFPPSFVTPDKWPQLMPVARKFANSHPNARFALLRIWSAPHFYPLMVGLQNRALVSFLDSAGRSWEWKFVPKDMPGSEFSAHRTSGNRLELLKKQIGDRVEHRGDLILVMGEDADDLLKYCTTVTFAMQTKPWLREVDLWKSFINVDMKFLEELDPFWLD